MSETYLIPKEDVLGYNVDEIKFAGVVIPANSIFVTDSFLSLFGECGVQYELHIGTANPKVILMNLHSEQEYDSYSKKTRDYLKVGVNKDNKVFKITADEAIPELRILLKMSF